MFFLSHILQPRIVQTLEKNIGFDTVPQLLGNMTCKYTFSSSGVLSPTAANFIFMRATLAAVLLDLLPLDFLGLAGLEAVEKICVCVLMLNLPVNNFSVMSERSHHFLGITSTFSGSKCAFV